MFQAAGKLGVSPWKFSLRELLWMLEGRQINEWDHTATIVATLLNCHRDPKRSQPINPESIHPIRSKKNKTKLTPDRLRLLAKLENKHVTKSKNTS